jgi:hypothetical protein
VEPVDAQELTASPTEIYNYATRPNRSPTMQTSRTTSKDNSRSQTAADSDDCVDRVAKQRITLVCFGPSEDIETRLNGLKKSCQGDRWRDILHDPYILLDIILDELYLQVSQHVRALTFEFGKIENVSLNLIKLESAEFRSRVCHTNHQFSQSYKLPGVPKRPLLTQISPFCTTYPRTRFTLRKILMLSSTQPKEWPNSTGSI